jgi:ribonuclease P protein component
LGKKFLEKKNQNNFRKAQKIKRHIEIRRILKTGKKWDSTRCTVYSLQNGMKRNRCAVLVPGETGTAVKRNKIKRYIREQFRIFLKDTPLHIDILVKIHPEKDVKESNYRLEKALLLWLKTEKK